MNYIFIKSYLIILLLLSASCIHYAQTCSLKGKVVDEQFNPIPGVNIVIPSTGYGTASDQSGNYEFRNIPSGNYTIEFSAIGFEKHRTEQIVLSENKIIPDIILKTKIIRTDEVVVTAGKYLQKKSELPVSAEILYGNELIEQNFSSIEYAMRYVPGIVMTEDQVSIRGSSGYSRGVGARALFTLDGLPFYTGDTGEIVWEMIPPTEIQRIEIIKGAASSLYGSSAIGGVISAITREVAANPQTIINGFYGFYDKPHYDEWDWSGERRPFNGITLSHSNSFDKFGFNLSLTRLEDLGYRENDFFKKYIGFLKAVYDFTPSSSLTLIANTFNKQRGNFLYWKDSRNALVNSGQVDGDRVETNRYMFGLIFKKVVYDNMVLNIKTNYYRNNFEDNGEPINKSTSHLYRGEVQVNASITESIMLTTGLELVPAKVNSSLFGNPTSFGAGVYAVTDINFNFPLIASLGIRYDYNKLDSLDTYGAVSPKIGFNFQPFNNLIFRTSLGTGFRAPSLAEAFTSTTSSGITIKPNPEIKPESNLTTEIGINFIPANIIELDFAAFHNEYYDMIEAGIDPQDGLAVFENVVRARIQGFEFNTVINLIPGNVKMNFGYTYLWARNIETGTALKYRPRHSFVSGINLNKWNIGLGINFRYSSRVEEIDDDLVNLGIVTDGELRVPVYLTDINLSFKLIFVGLPVEIYLNIKNIFNYNYIELIGNLRPIRNYSLGFNLIL